MIPLETRNASYLEHNWCNHICLISGGFIIHFMVLHAKEVKFGKSALALYISSGSVWNMQKLWTFHYHYYHYHHRLMSRVSCSHGLTESNEPKSCIMFQCPLGHGSYGWIPFAMPTNLQCVLSAFFSYCQHYIELNMKLERLQTLRRWGVKRYTNERKRSEQNKFLAVRQLHGWFISEFGLKLSEVLDKPWWSYFSEFWLQLWEETQ